MGANSERVKTLLQLTGLEDRMINNYDEFEFCNLKKLAVDKSFEQNIEYSKSFLKNAING